MLFMPKVSVIVPNYNHASYLHQRIESILNQTYQDFELIILDDCSTDNSRAIIEQYRNHPKVSRIVYNEKNSGSTFIQWNKGFDLAKGEYIWIAESDDYADISFLDKLLKCIEENDKIVIAYSTSYFVNEKNKITRDGLRSEPYLKAKADGKLYKIYNGIDYIKKHLLKSSDIYNASSAIFRNNAVEKISNEYMDYKSCGDKLFWIELASQGMVVYYYENLNFFRQHTCKATPKSLLSGRLFEEELKIFHSNIKKGYISRMKKLFVIGFYIAWIRLISFDSRSKKENLLNVWEEQTLYPHFALKLDIIDKKCFEFKFKAVRVFYKNKRRIQKIMKI